MGEPTSAIQLSFLDYIQRLFDEGEFTATYKYALLMSLADISVENGDDSGDSLEITAKEIAAKFIKYYQRQALPFIAVEGDADSGILHQNTGGQARVVNLVRDAKRNYEFRSPSRVDLQRNNSKLVNEVASTVAVMPLWKLQVLRGSVHDFLYPNIGKGRTIELRPGIAFCFRRFHGFVHKLAQSEWIRFIRNRRQNRVLLGEITDLGAFLFGSERGNLEPYRAFLMDLQRRECFYCGSRIKAAEVDHFIPWSRYSFDLGHNFVVACPTCNHRKRDLLASEPLLDKWLRRNDDCEDAMDQFFRESNLDHDLRGSLMVARWAYGQVEKAEGLVWQPPQQTRRLHSSWRACFS